MQTPRATLCENEGMPDKRFPIFLCRRQLKHSGLCQALEITGGYWIPVFAFRQVIEKGTEALDVFLCGASNLGHMSPALDPSMNRAIGRANRWLIWQDILYFKRLGVIEFDFGGRYEGKEDTERLRINEFKDSFGAELEKNYNHFYATTLKEASDPWLRPLA